MNAYEPTGYTGLLMVGVAELLDERGIGVYRPDEKYLAGERGIYFDYSPPFPSTTPQETLTITPYLPQQGMLAIEHTSVQLRYQLVGRGALYVRDLLDTVRAIFPWQGVTVLNGLTFDRVVQRSSTTWGEEDRPGVLNATQNFAFRGNRYE